MVSQILGDWLHNYSTKTRQAGHANEHFMYFLMLMDSINQELCFTSVKGKAGELVNIINSH